MGSFYASCSITNKTITDGDEMVIQFMVPSWSTDFNIGRGKLESYKLDVKIFTQMVRLHGLEKALEMYKEDLTKIEEEIDASEPMAPKGLLVSNDGATAEWVPIGPAIRGIYDDYGHIAVSEDPVNQARIKILEEICFGVPFNSIMEAATDDRWFRFGFREEDTMWKVEGLGKNLSPEALKFFKCLSISYIHAKVYDEISNPDFCSEDGKIKGKYSKEWKKGFTDPVEKELIPNLALMKKAKADLEAPKDPESLNIEGIIATMNLRHVLNNFFIIKSMSRNVNQTYLERLAAVQDITNFDWLVESLNFIYGLTGMCVPLRQSQYGSQHQNWKGWTRIEKALNPVLKEKMKEWAEW